MHPRARSSLFVTGLLAAAAASPLAAQTLHVAGTALRNVANGYSRGGAGLNAGELLQRFDADDMRGFGIDAATPGMQLVHGIAVQARDFGSSVPDGLFDVTLYTENQAQPGYPDLNAPLGGVADVAGTPFPLGVVFAYFTPPIQVPIGRDVFVGIRVNATTSQFGGLRLNTLTSNTAASIHDLAGAGMPTSPATATSYRLFRDLVTNQLTYQSRGQYMIDLLTTTPSGFASTLSSQAGYQQGSVPPGATTMLSGLHPDAASPPLNPGRIDQLGFVYADQDLAPGSPVVFIASFTGFGPVVPLDALSSGSVGALCLDPQDLFLLGIAPLSAAHDAWLQTIVDAAVRPGLLGRAWFQQAIGIDLATWRWRGSMCVRQRF